MVSRGDLEIFGFHAARDLAVHGRAPRPARKPQGVVAVTCLEGNAVWDAGDRGLVTGTTRRALSLKPYAQPGRSETEYARLQATRGPRLLDAVASSIAFVVEYADGFRATALILNGHVDDTTFAGRVAGADEREELVSTLVYLPAPRGRFFDPLVLRIEDFLDKTASVSRRADAPDRGHSRRGGSRAGFGIISDSRTPDLAAIDYQAPADSGYIRTPIAHPRANRPPSGWTRLPMMTWDSARVSRFTERPAEVALPQNWCPSSPREIVAGGIGGQILASVGSGARTRCRRSHGAGDHSA